MALPIRPPFEPMLAKLARALPPPGDVVYEPKWDGFRCVVFRDGDALDLQSRNQKPLLRYFPELAPPLLDALPERCVLDGEIVVVTEQGLDFDALQLRQHPAQSRVERLSKEIPATYVAFDLLALDDEDVLDVPFTRRREKLEAVITAPSSRLLLTPTSRDRSVAQDWFERFEGAGFDGVMVKPAGDAYRPGKRAMIKVKHERTADCVVAGYRLHKDGAGVGSLLLGVFDDEGVLHHIGVASSMAAKLRSELLDFVTPYATDGAIGHPWQEWAEWSGRAGVAAQAEGRAPDRRMPGGASRWNADKDLTWVPLRCELVAEVAYEGMQGERFRHNSRFKRWRDDRTPESCTYEQLAVTAPVELQSVFASG